jgi:hypothetical protein
MDLRPRKMGSAFPGLLRNSLDGPQIDRLHYFLFADIYVSHLSGEGTRVAGTLGCRFQNCLA